MGDFLDLLLPVLSLIITAVGGLIVGARKSRGDLEEARARIKKLESETRGADIKTDLSAKSDVIKELRESYNLLSDSYQKIIVRQDEIQNELYKMRRERLEFLRRIEALERERDSERSKSDALQSKVDELTSRIAILEDELEKRNERIAELESQVHGI